MDAQRIIIIALIGIVAGWLASLVVGSPRFGVVGLLIAGLLGAFVGSFLLGALGVRIAPGNPIVDSIVTAAIGAIVVILLARLIA